MLDTALQSRWHSRPLDMPGLLEVLAHNSSRPRYAFMVLNLIAKAAGANGSAGPLIANDGEMLTVRDWLCDALAPMGHRDLRRHALVERVREEMVGKGGLPADPVDAERAIETEIRARVRVSGKTNVSRAVSDLVRAGLLFRHYQGYCVDHHNRGGQRQAVYTLTPAARGLLQAETGSPAPRPRFRQASLPFG
jgi:hypothetical protein